MPTSWLLLWSPAVTSAISRFAFEDQHKQREMKAFAATCQSLIDATDGETGDWQYELTDVHLIRSIHTALVVISLVLGKSSSHLDRMLPSVATSAWPPGHRNLPAVWDAAGGLYSSNDWALDIDDFKPTLQSNATELIALLHAVLVADSALREVVLETYSYADTVVYSGMDLNATSSGNYPCPSSSYLAMAGEISQQRIAVGGTLLAVIHKHFAAQLRTLGLAD
ncbi:hypothetical protein PHYPSEUDO_012646 [Phytophthora pseudosyringae]|uniref:Uncharacterized protein n=1 Tax=Phytophthora pseudosyringae TaxID=221518 RepID=A0A8T1V6H2_9STRA|nr:hypothetical protein PHYPSEUDO_012646 [Phytophthora pseudosyringae]